MRHAREASRGHFAAGVGGRTKAIDAPPRAGTDKPPTTYRRAPSDPNERRR